MPTETLPGREPAEVAALSAGLDALETEVRARPSRWRRVWSAAWPVLLAVAVVLGAWELAVRLGLQERSVLPSPADVAGALGGRWRAGELQPALAYSLERVTLGFLLSAVAGIVLGVIVARVRAVRLPLQPVLTGLQALPAAALVPIAVIWFSGPGGIGDGVVYAVMLLGAAPSVAIGVVAGIDQIPPLLHRVGRVLGARRLTAARHIVVPAALPGVVNGLKNGWMFTWRALMTAEIINTGMHGIGSELNAARKSENVALVLGVTIVILAVGVVAERAVFGPAERAVLRRRGLVERTP
jgi:NitT/TauT family transport system permease protein